MASIYNAISGIDIEGKRIFADIVGWVGDNKEQNSIGGWRGVMVCRHCTLDLSQRDPPAATTRTLQEHNLILQRMEMEENERVGHQQHINGPSFLSALPGFDIIQQLGQDHIMHDELEGIYSYCFMPRNDRHALIVSRKLQTTRSGFSAPRH